MKPDRRFHGAAAPYLRDARKLLWLAYIGIAAFMGVVCYFVGGLSLLAWAGFFGGMYLALSLLKPRR